MKRTKKSDTICKEQNSQYLAYVQGSAFRIYSLMLVSPQGE